VDDCRPASDRSSPDYLRHDEAVRDSPKNTDNSRFLQMSNFQYTPFEEALDHTVAWFAANYHVPGAIKL
jgi:hypothetical protein